MTLRAVLISALLATIVASWAAILAVAYEREHDELGVAGKRGTELVTIAGVVTTTLADAAEKAGLSQRLLVDMTDIFASQVDFSQGVREGDRFRGVVERIHEPGRPPRWGYLTAVEYETYDARHTAVRFASERSHAGYYRPDGSSLKQKFLRSPLRYSRVTSGFQLARYHPILNVVRPHWGTDYAAPVGTPVLAVADGLVKAAEYRGDAGRMVELEHGGGHASSYLHLSRFALHTKPGARVRMGQVIGYVGSTGLSTGPHLHFELRERGRLVDSQRLRLPSLNSLDEGERARFDAHAREQLALLPAWPATVAGIETGRDGPPQL